MDTNQSALKTILQLAIPLIISNFIVQLYLLLENMLIGWTLGVHVLAGYTAALTIYYLFSNLAVGLILGLTIHLSNAYGARDFHRLKRSVFINYFYVVILCLSITAIGHFFLDEMLAVLNIAAESYAYAYDFLKIMFWGYSAQTIFVLLTYMFRGLGDSRTPSLFIILVSIINITLDYLAVAIFDMGIQGIALAFLLANLLGVILCFVAVRKKWPILYINFSHRQFRVSEFIGHLKNSIPIAVQSIIISIGAFFVQRSLNEIGSDAVAAQGIGARIDMFCIIGLSSIGLAMATFTAQNLGANQYARILEGVKVATILSIAIAGIFSIIFLFSGSYLVHFVSGADLSSAVVDYGTRYFLFHVPFYWTLSLLFIYRYTLQGLGYSLFPSLAGMAEVLMRILAATVLYQFMGFNGVILGDGLAWSAAALVCTINFLMIKDELQNQFNVSERV
ncbi:MATE family efflux transporter [Fundicoccus culcitae]|uniref:Probable multidrug resistance protein NorM n=1 Tax=Fundicoccus culcitae TaxID=2969821 RepID=A0ABY5P5U1_9LACT|nr:MATE family efflux transporter [Fundicoccus culcitae]UUX33845.1 MATE family efflux transporter [Fundicoccus culcitae]